MQINQQVTNGFINNGKKIFRRTALATFLGATTLVAGGALLSKGPVADTLVRTKEDITLATGNPSKKEIAEIKAKQIMRDSYYTAKGYTDSAIDWTKEHPVETEGAATTGILLSLPILASAYLNKKDD